MQHFISSGSDTRPMLVDHLFMLSIISFGLGLSVMTYGLFARRHGWPRGSLYMEAPLVPVILGLFALGTGLAFAVARGAPSGGLIIVACGALLALFWTGFLRVGSQIGLILAPLAAIALIFGWLAIPIGF